MDQGLILKKAKNFSLVFTYADADWAGYPDNAYSTTGYAAFLDPNLVS